MTIPELEEQFKYIKRMSDALGQGQNVGVLTFDNRDSWAKVRVTSHVSLISLSLSTILSRKEGKRVTFETEN